MLKIARLRRALLAGALAIGLAGGATLPAQATANVTTSRLAGNDRYGTAAAIATNAYPSGAGTVIVASGRSFPDALAGAALAAQQTAPVLLTEPTSLPAATSNAIDTLKATKAVILGGTTAVSQAVETELAKKVTVSRVAGTNRYDTAAKIAAAIGTSNVGSTGGGKAALIATGANFADALAGGPLSAAGSSGVFPVLLVDSGVPSQTRSALTELGIKQTVILGGTSAVSEAVANELQQITGNAPQRVAGNDRYATATAIAALEFGTFGFSKTAVYLANGENFADALAGGALGGKNKTAILLTPTASLAGPTQTFLSSNKDTIAAITALGGTAAVSDSTLAAAKAAAQGEAATPATIAVSPAGDASQTTGTSRTYTATGLTGPVDIALLDCEGVTGSGGFDNANDNTIADGTAAGGSAPDTATTPASIQTVNGAPNLASNNDYADNASPSDGKITFVVAGPTSGTACVRPVVFTDANSDNALNSNAASPATPTETFGLGGETTFQPEAAGSGSFSGLSVSSVDKDGNSFVACNNLQQCNTYNYDSGDQYSVDAVDGDMGDFEDNISPSDNVSGNYRPGDESDFFLTDDSPSPPAVLNASYNAAEGTVSVSFSDSTTQSVDSYKLYRTSTGTKAGDVPGSVNCDDATGYAAVATVTDGNAALHSYNDNVAEPATGTTYFCYLVASVDEGDEGPKNESPRGVAVPAKD